MAEIPDKIWLYHLTHVDNLESIIKSNGLLCHNSCNIPHISIAHEHIQARRKDKIVPIGVNGSLHDYVPFFFGSKPPMLYSQFKRTVEGYDGGQEPLIYLAVSLKSIIKGGLSFVFTDGHAAMDFTEFYDNLDDLKNVDWPLMSATYWNDTNDDPDRSRRRQAEFLIHRFCPWELIAAIATKNEVMKDKVIEIIEDAQIQHKPNVKSSSKLYY